MDLPFTADEFLAAVPATFARPENARQVRAKPRASSLAGPARCQWYDMQGYENEVPYAGGPDMALTQEQGRIVEDLVVAVLEHMGYTVECRQVELSSESFATGHPDGGILTGPGIPEDLTVGLEVKHYGRYSYEKILKSGFMDAEPDVVAQILTYGIDLGWGACLVAVVSQDASSVRSDMTRNAKVKNKENQWADKDAMNPKVQLFMVDLRPLKTTLGPMLAKRAAWLSKCKSPPDPECDPRADPKTGEPVFPCSYCEHRQRCLDDGPGGPKAPRLPWMEESAWKA